MNNRRNYYRILHVQPDAPNAVIQYSYRALMQKLKRHPDLGGNHEEAVLINKAYAALMDPIKRASYDRDLMQQHSKSSLAGQRFHESDDETENQPEQRYEKTKNVNSKKCCLFCQTPHNVLLDSMPDATCTNCESPLSLATPVDLEQSCRRAVKRVVKNDPVHFYTNWPQKHNPGKLQDISPNGMLFITSQPVATEKIIKLASELLHAVAVVMSCQSTAGNSASAYSVGVRFLTLRFQNSKGTFVFESA